MNLAIRNINSQFVAWNTEGSFLKDAHPDLKADFILANPPFNQSDWGQEFLQEDARWKYGIPPAGNANYAWMQHMLYHLATNGVMATVLSNNSLTSNISGEGDIRNNIFDKDYIDCIVTLPKQLFYNTGIPACIWILRKEKKHRNNEILFIDASNLGFMKDTTHRDFNISDIQKITETYHKWIKNNLYVDIAGFCISLNRSEIDSSNLFPGKYIKNKAEIISNISFKDNLNIINSFLINFNKFASNIDTRISQILNEIDSDLIWDNLSFSSNEILEDILNNIYFEWFAKYKDEEIPTNWKEGKLSDICDITSGKRPTNKSDTKTETNSIPLVGASKIMGYVEEYLFDDKTIVIGRVGTHGEIQIFNEKIWPSDNTLVIKSKYFGFTYQILKRIDYSKLNRGAVQPLITQTDLKNYPIIIPDDYKLNLFSELSDLIIERIILNTKQMEELQKNRILFSN